MWCSFHVSRKSNTLTILTYGELGQTHRQTFSCVYLAELIRSRSLDYNLWITICWNERVTYSIELVVLFFFHKLALKYLDLVPKAFWISFYKRAVEDHFQYWKKKTPLFWLLSQNFDLLTQNFKLFSQFPVSKLVSQNSEIIAQDFDLCFHRNLLD